MLITGADGMLASALRRRFARSDGPREEVLWTDVEQLDITDSRAVEEFVRWHRPDVIVNCAALTDVDGCEGREDEAFRVNAEAVDHLARAADETGGLLVQISTDFVFSGDAERPYREDDPTGPLSVYGRSKLAGEEMARRADRHLLVRTSWLYGPNGKNFVASICRRADAGESLRVVSDQTGCPTYTEDVAETLWQLLRRGATGTFHACGAEATTWFEFARAIVARWRPGALVKPIRSSDVKRSAPRPAMSVLDCSRLERTIGSRPPGFTVSLPKYLDEMAAELSRGP